MPLRCNEIVKSNLVWNVLFPFVLQSWRELIILVLLSDNVLLRGHNNLIMIRFSYWLMLIGKIAFISLDENNIYIIVIAIGSFVPRKFIASSVFVIRS